MVLLLCCRVAGSLALGERGEGGGVATFIPGGVGLVLSELGFPGYFKWVCLLLVHVGNEGSRTAGLKFQKRSLARSLLFLPKTGSGSAKEYRSDLWHAFFVQQHRTGSS